MQFETLKALIATIEGTDIVEVEIQQGGEHGERVRIRRAEQGTPGVAPARGTAAMAPPSAPPAPVAVDTVQGHILTSPIVGTFYKAPDPNSPPFVKVGDVVRKGQVLCIVEAMKLMNEIESDVAGEVLKIHHENGEPVQFGEPLFTIRT